MPIVVQYILMEQYLINFTTDFTFESWNFTIDDFTIEWI